MTQEKQDTDRLRRAFALAAAFALLLWLIKLTELVFGLDLSDLSIFPGRPETLPGLVLAPLLHGSLSHLFANTAPILVLGTLLVYGYPKAVRILLPAVYLGSGLGVWLYARPAWHLGASGLTFGMMFFVFTVGILRWDRRAIALSLVVFLLYGGMIWGIFPMKPGVSFEYHLFGAGIGVLLAFALRGLDPPPPAKKYSWEDDNAEDDDWRFAERSEDDKNDFLMDDATCDYPERERWKLPFPGSMAPRRLLSPGQLVLYRLQHFRYCSRELVPDPWLYFMIVFCRPPYPLGQLVNFHIGYRPLLRGY